MTKSLYNQIDSKDAKIMALTAKSEIGEERRLRNSRLGHLLLVSQT